MLPRHYYIATFIHIRHATARRYAMPMIQDVTPFRYHSYDTFDYFAAASRLPATDAHRHRRRRLID